MSTPTKPAKRAALYDVEVNDGTSFVVEAANAQAADDAASKQLAEAGKPAATYTVTKADSAKRTADKTASLADDLLAGIDEPAPAAPAKREAKPDPKPTTRKATGRKPAAKAKPAPKAKPARTNAQVEADREAAKKAEAAKAAKKAEATTTKTAKQTKHELLLTFGPEAAQLWNALAKGDDTRTAALCRARLREQLDAAHPEHANQGDGDDFKPGLFSGRVPALLASQGIDARKLPAHLAD